MSFLPARPLRLQRGYMPRAYALGIALLLVGLGVTSAYVAWQWGDAAQILADEDVWARGVPALASDVEGSTTTRQLIFTEYELDVRYKDPAGGVHTTKSSFSTLGGGPDTSKAAEVRVDPRDASRFALSWGIESKTTRWISFGVLFSIGSALGLMVVWLGVMGIRRARLTVALARDSVEVECPVISALPQYVNGRATGHMIYNFFVPPAPRDAADPGYRAAPEAPPPAPSVARSTILPKKRGGPFYVQRGKYEQVLVVVSRDDPSQFILLGSDFYPFDLDDAQRAAAIAQVRTS
ncbi:MAG TPA: hypothetical protein VGM56_16790 [Byssovorax sp.]|jgi:hypothetical protein|nr:hypothetical protein [Polyangia bacterium]